jgi:hypothetical protein
VRNVLLQILADLAADDLFEALVVVVDGASHGSLKMTNDENSNV